ncbi:MAG: hypothetical protein AAF491_06050, partial [Verrucomicrobiota bacterium]
MNLRPVALILTVAFSAPLFADDRRPKATPNPAEAGFPNHWSASSWDTREGSNFWSKDATSSERKSPSSTKPLPSPQ